jgi:hypothetical protein
MVRKANEDDWRAQWPAGDCVLKRIGESVKGGDAGGPGVAGRRGKRRESGMPVAREAKICFD